MNPQQFQEAVSQQFLQTFQMMPWWIKAIYGITFFAICAVAICLPLLTWRAFSRSRATVSGAEEAALRREILELKREVESWKK